MRRLYFRIYLAVLGSLALFGVLVGLTGWIFKELRQPEPEAPFLSDVADHLLPQDASQSVLAQELQFWHKRTGFDLALLSPAGDVVARAGPVSDERLAALVRSGPHGFHWYARHGAFLVDLAGGRQLVAIRAPPKFGFLFPLRWVGLVFAIGLAVAVCAYPVVRRLTRNLERLQQGVAAFGQGNLGMRVAVSGRDEVGKLAETFNASADRIEALVKAQKTLLANASHELRSPLARLRMAAEAVGATAPAQQQEEIARNISELDELVEEILLASRLDAEAATISDPREIDLAGLLAEECAPFGADLFVVPGKSVPVKGDAKLLRRLFRNLLENARRHGGQGPIEVEMSCNGGRAIVAVCDHGPGIPNSETGRIFEAFYRPKTRSDQNAGTGLGLSLVKQIAEKHLGNVEYVPREKCGACFRVSLPLSSPSAGGAGS